MMRDLKINTEISQLPYVAPNQAISVVLNDGMRELSFARWGLIPAWAKDDTIARHTFNARVETIAEKPSFKVPLRKKRCLIWASGFYEWTLLPGDKKKTPVFIQMKDEDPFAFAGLWDKWRDPEDNIIVSATIITTEANELMLPFHHRMPVILPPERFDLWLDPKEKSPSELLPILKQYPADLMKARYGILK